ncbi:MAG: IclR family transcriptional regulator [Bosea sp.]|uniref:IclR family transcriptional regulator n=1 Tax=Bosea sp. (in: a-proteobacteria) TaxID=1871050 RepID=UPI0023996A44|nr:IclR family transcriptional regulator [Bosea sp. (in: a-proteobacteria)]MCP4736092.1 IclR family transcriptional regulator [Bosea sp. (in: a-proteobacteria)]
MTAETAADARSRPYPAPALEKGLEIIELLALAQTPLSARAIAERLGRSKNEIFRMLFVLIERGYLDRDPATDEIALSNRLFELGMRVPRARDLVAVATPALEALSEKIGQSSHLVVLSKGETVVIVAVAGPGDINFTLRLGYRRPASASTSGQVILAFRDGAGPDPSLPAIAADGFLIADSHDVVGVTDISAPILDRKGQAIASIVVPYLNRREARPQHREALAELLATCRAIAGELG